MKIKRVYIQNFRSIKKIEIFPRDLCALIGPNSSGKTNILKAIDLVIGEGWTTKAKVARELFNNVNEEIFIQIDFESPVDWNYYNNKVTVNTVTLKMTYQPLSCDVRLWVDYPHDKDGNGYYMNDSFKKDCNFIYIPSERNLKDELRVSQWTMLGKMMKLIYDNYVMYYKNDELKLKEEFKLKMKQAKDFLEDDFSEDITFKKFMTIFEEKCKQNSMGLATGFKPVLDIYNINWFYKTLQIHVSEGSPEILFNSEEVGAGMQNLLMISIFQTYAELMGGKVVFGIEEPEIFLYPQAQRSLYKSFKLISKITQVFYTTHSPVFVDASRPDDFILLRKNTDKGTYKLNKESYFTSKNAEKDKNKHKIHTHFNSERNEIFFAKKVLLVEGHSDKVLFTILSQEKWLQDLDNLGVSIIECGGKSGVNYFVGICKLAGVKNYFAVWDEDPNDDKYKPDKDLLSKTLKDAKGVEIPVNLENFLGLPESKDAEKVKNAYDWATNIEKSKIPKIFDKIYNFIK